MNYRKFLVAIFVCTCFYFFPQNIFSDNIEKANQYFEKYDYKFALQIYEKIMAKKPTLNVAQKIASCYRYINDSEGAEKAYARVLTFANFEPVNLKYYGDALKQNEKYSQAKISYQKFGNLSPQDSQNAAVLANSCDVARLWANNPDARIIVENYSKINSEFSDFSPSINQGKIIFISDRWFSGASGKQNKDVYGWTGNPYLKLYETSLENKTGVISPLPKPINSTFHNGPATFTSSGDTLYYTRTQTPAKRNHQHKLIIRNSIYLSVKQGFSWSEPVRILGDGVSYSAQHPALSPEGNILYFASDKKGGYGGMDIYAAQKNSDGTWGELTNCGPNINTKEDESFPYVKTDGKFYFSSKGNVGMGGFDIFSSTGRLNSFTPAVNLKSPLNSSRDDFGIVFTSDSVGYVSSNRKGGKGLDDIYSFNVPQLKKVEADKLIFAVNGQVLQKGTALPVADVRVVLTNQATNSQSSAFSDIDGRFHFDLQKDMDYIISGDRDKYYAKEDGQLSTKTLTQSTIFEVKFEMEKSKDEFIVRLKNIYYNFDKWNIRSDAKPELNKVVSFLSALPDVKIEMRSHTDSRGPAIYNKWLSQKRAQSTVNYLAQKGIETVRLTAKGLGETELLNRCKDGVKCSKKEHQYNRRTEFKVLKNELSLSMLTSAITVKRK